MKAQNLIKVLHAAHWSYLVEGKWLERGGIMLVSPPGSLKSSFIKTLTVHDRALIMSDVNVPTINRLREDIAIGRYRTLAFTEFEKIYQRDPATSRNIEAHLRAFVDEGFRTASYEDARMVRRQAYCMVIGAITTNCYQRRFAEWEDSGFGRRFLWVHYALADPDIITRAIADWKRLSFKSVAFLEMSDQDVPYNLSKQEATRIRKFLPPDSNTCYTLLQKIAVVLKHSEGRNYMDILEDFAECLTGEGARLYIEPNQSHHSKKAGRNLQRGSVRGNSKHPTKATRTALRLHGLEAERKLPAVPESGLGSNSQAKVTLPKDRAESDLASERRP